MHRNPFSDAEIERRQARLRLELVKRDLDAAVISQPDNVFYLTGLDHWGYFAPHLLIIGRKGASVLVTRSMERVSVERQVRSAQFRGHPDSETASDETARTMQDLGFTGRRIGLEYVSSGLSYGVALSLQAQLEARWDDISGLVDTMRLIKSGEEQTLMRKAAKVTDAAAGATIAAIADGAREADVAAECMAAMIRAGGHPPGFGPFIRPGMRLGEEHATWGDGRYASGEPVFLELSGCMARYHAPLGRLVRIGAIRDEDAEMAELARGAFDAVVGALTLGALAGDVYAAWQAVVDRAGLAHYRRHHCGYAVGIGVPPSWTGGNRVTGLSAGSDLKIAIGMSFHVLSWLMGTGKGDDFISNTVLITAEGAEVLNRAASGPLVK
jgi:Xaa-Pro dipeptidase